VRRGEDGIEDGGLPIEVNWTQSRMDVRSDSFVPFSPISDANHSGLDVLTVVFAQ